MRLLAHRRGSLNSRVEFLFSLPASDVHGWDVQFRLWWKARKASQSLPPGPETAASPASQQKLVMIASEAARVGHALCSTGLDDFGTEPPLGQKAGTPVPEDTLWIGKDA